ncbi:hypothetical protein [Hymenobacter jejuensis]|uniref:STAS/SEC14 domain-containing protein n=1 Tax=Hymenobacter jejuensis TaxID=2502781 RepID=A0A5B8A341_9BACT|nr:hypothetical protein [Hymenobacter jejuensis]QDA60562.1 hypothetical protein FHG12_10780 [Hymenobacter jejuensis]
MICQFASDVLRIHLHQQEGVLETEWLGSAKGEALRHALSETLRLARLYRVHGWIANHRQLGPITPADQDWIQEQYMPVFRLLPLQRFGLVYSGDPFGRLSIHNIMARAQGQLGCEVQQFALVEEARRWVLEAVAVR